MTALNKYGLIGAICLGGINGLLTYRLDKANDANQTQSDKNKVFNKVVDERDETITALKGAADADRRATEEQLRIEQQKREKADAENRTLRKVLESSNCSNQHLPDSAIGILRREG
jgi:hypothetical protein